MNKGEMWLVDIPSTNGHEQTGARPAVILADTPSNVAVVMPLTSNLQALRFPFTLEIRPTKRNGLVTISVGLVLQIRAIDKKRLKKKIGDIEESTIKNIDIMIKKLFLV